jgi:hypothetical protein
MAGAPGLLVSASRPTAVTDGIPKSPASPSSPARMPQPGPGQLGRSLPGSVRKADCGRSHRCTSVKIALNAGFFPREGSQPHGLPVLLGGSPGKRLRVSWLALPGRQGPDQKEVADRAARPRPVLRKNAHPTSTSSPSGRSYAPHAAPRRRGQKAAGRSTTGSLTFSETRSGSSSMSLAMNWRKWTRW